MSDVGLRLFPFHTKSYCKAETYVQSLLHNMVSRVFVLCSYFDLPRLLHHYISTQG